MLRITISSPGEKHTCVFLEGKLIGPWVDELEAVALSALDCGDLTLELSGVQFIDDAGLDLLRCLQARRAAMQAVSPFVQELLTTRNS